MSIRQSHEVRNEMTTLMELLLIIKKGTCSTLSKHKQYFAPRSLHWMGNSTFTSKGDNYNDVVTYLPWLPQPLGDFCCTNHYFSWLNCSFLISASSIPLNFIICWQFTFWTYQNIYLPLRWHQSKKFKNSTSVTWKGGSKPMSYFVWYHIKLIYICP